MVEVDAYLGLTLVFLQVHSLDPGLSQHLLGSQVGHLVNERSSERSWSTDIVTGTCMLTGQVECKNSIYQD